MKSLILVILSFVSMSSQADVIAHLQAGSDLIQVYDDPCDDTKTAGLIEMKRGETLFKGCWQSNGNSLIVKWNDGDEDVIPQILFSVGPAPVRHLLPRTMLRKWQDV